MRCAPAGMGAFARVALLLIDVYLSFSIAVVPGARYAQTAQREQAWTAEGACAQPPCAVSRSEEGMA